MATLIQYPDALSFSRNLKEIIISSSDLVNVKIMTGELSGETFVPIKTLLNAKYVPWNSKVILDINEIVTEELAVALPTSEEFKQSTSRVIGIFLGDGSSPAGRFRAVLGGVENMSGTVADFLASNFLTWQPKYKTVTVNQPEWLTYYFVYKDVMKIRFYNADGTTKDVILYTHTDTMNQVKIMSIDCKLSRLWPLGRTIVSGVEKERHGYIDLWVENASGVRKTYIQRYYRVAEKDTDFIYVCENTLGGLDTYRMSGERKFKPEIDREVASYDEYMETAYVEARRRWSQNTGILPNETARTIWEFLNSRNVWYLDEGVLKAIAIDKASVTISNLDSDNSGSFDYVLSSDRGLLNIER